MSQLSFAFCASTKLHQPSAGDLVPPRGLLIRDPYISDILAGRKRWELRGFPTRIRGRIGLIKSTSGRVFAECVLRECIGPLELDVLLRSSEIGPNDLREIQQSGAPPYTNVEGVSTTYAWVFDEVRVYSEPIPYRHPSGAVTFVDLTRAMARSCTEASPF
jgi:hypothetical protein